MTFKQTGFGGNVFDGDTKYVEGLLTSWFNVIPPGHFNNYNHRYTESCIVGSIPLILAHNSIDPSRNSNWTNNLSCLQGHSFSKLVDFVNQLDEMQLTSLAKMIQKDDFLHIARLKTELYRTLEI